MLHGTLDHSWMGEREGDRVSLSHQPMLAEGLLGDRGERRRLKAPTVVV